MHLRIKLSLICLLIPAFAICGCAEANPLGRLPISGEVSLDGQPIDNGSIQFAPTDTQGGIASGALITNGTYNIAAEQGLTPGIYTVRISAPEGGVATDDPGGETEGLVATERIPAEYNSESKHTVEVKAGDSNTFNFRIDRTEAETD
jgi:hypothetical protein